MPKRFFIVSVLVLLPFTALADDATQSNASSSLLGPQATTSAGSSPTDSGALQPAGTTPLQSTTGDFSGLASQGTSALQAPASSDQALRVLSGEADGTPHDPSAAGPNLWLPFSIVLLAGVGLMIVWRDRRRFRATDPSH